MYHCKLKILRQSFTDGKVVVDILQKKLRQMSNRNTAISYVSIECVHNFFYQFYTSMIGLCKKKCVRYCIVASQVSILSHFLEKGGDF